MRDLAGGWFPPGGGFAGRPFVGWSVFCFFERSWEEEWVRACVIEGCWLGMGKSGWIGHQGLQGNLSLVFVLVLDPCC